MLCLDWESFGVLDEWSLMGGGLLRILSHIEVRLYTKKVLELCTPFLRLNNLSVIIPLKTLDLERR